MKSRPRPRDRTPARLSRLRQLTVGPRRYGRFIAWPSPASRAELPASVSEARIVRALSRVRLAADRWFYASRSTDKHPKTNQTFQVANALTERRRFHNKEQSGTTETSAISHGDCVTQMPDFNANQSNPQSTVKSSGRTTIVGMPFQSR